MQQKGRAHLLRKDLQFGAINEEPQNNESLQLGSKTMVMNNIAVVGGGTMGTGIAYVAAQAGCHVTVVEPNERTAESMQGALSEAAENGIARGRLDKEGARSLLERINQVCDVEDIALGMDLAIETVPERADIKLNVLRKITQREPSIIASNTSALSIDELSKAVTYPHRFLGLHFFNPVWSIKLVEIVVGAQTSDETLTRAKAFSEQIGRQSLVVKNIPGFATSRLDLIASLEAMRMLEGGVASAEDIDRAAVVAYGHPIGPLRLSDIVGLDVRLDIARVLERAHGERYTPPNLLIDMVERGVLGRKTGRGFFEWSDSAQSQP